MFLIQKGKRDKLICRKHGIAHAGKRCPTCKAEWIAEEKRYRRMCKRFDRQQERRTS